MRDVFFDTDPWQDERHHRLWIAHNEAIAKRERKETTNETFFVREEEGQRIDTHTGRSFDEKKVVSFLHD